MIAEQNVIEGAYLQDILQQPQALTQSLAGFEADEELRRFARRMANGEYQRIVLTGMGSSLFALYPLHLALTNRGLPSLVVETAELIHYLDAVLDQRTLVVMVSQSGQSAEIVRLLDVTQKRAPVIGITNSPDSPLALRSQAQVLIRAGVESTVSCKTYVSSLLALEWLRAMVMDEDLSATRSHLGECIPAVESYVAEWRQHIADLAGLLDGVKHIFVTGRGPSVSPALTGGLIIKESTRFAAEGMSCAAFRHGPFEVLAPHVLVVIFAGDVRSRALNLGLARDVEEAGGKSVVVDVDAPLPVFRIPELPEAIRPVLEILPVQMITLALAAQSGREAGRFERATKITAVE